MSNTAIKRALSFIMALVLALSMIVLPASAVSPGDGTFIWPVSTSIPITAGAYYPDGSYHGATDFGASIGTPVYASAAGTVVTATDSGCTGSHYTGSIKCSNGSSCKALSTGTYGGWANWIIIDHGNGFYTLYGHLKTGSFQVKVGQTVSQGQQIALSGTAGYVTGPHLHFEIRKGSNTYASRVADPQAYLTKTNAPIPFEVVSPGTYMLKNTSTGTYLSVVNGTDADQTNIDLEGWNGDNQRLVLSKASDAYTCKLRPQCSSSRLVNAWGTSPSNGSNVNLYKDENDSTQWWKFQAVSGGYAIRLAYNTNLALTASGSNVIISTYTGASSQIWTLEPGNHTCNKGEYVFYEASHPHLKCYRCSICGQVWRNTAEPTKLESCTQCYPPVQEPTHTHSYTSAVTQASCTTFGYITYTCSGCGESYREYQNVSYSDWSVNRPTGVDPDLIEERHETRKSDLETTESYSASMSGWNIVSSKWVQNGSSTVNYVSSWPSGFDTSNSLYSTYHNSAKSASETTTDKVTINSTSTPGYIYWHWCRGSYTGGPIDRLVNNAKTSTFPAFHAFYSTTAPSSLTRDEDVYIYKNGNCCKDSYWYYATPVQSQSYTTYRKLFTYNRWTDWSAWSTTEYTASSTRKVETRTVYRYVTSQPTEHTWDNGIVTIPATCTNDGVLTYTCTVCQNSKTDVIPAIDHIYSVDEPYCLNGCGAANPFYDETPTTIDVDIVTAQPGETVTIPVTLKNNDGFAGFTLAIDYDREAMELAAITKGELLMPADGAITRNVSQGIVNWTDSTNTVGDGVLFTLTFKVSDNATSDYYDVLVSAKDDKPSNFVNAAVEPIMLVCVHGGVVVNNHTHEWSEWTVRTPATCTEAGQEQRMCVCGEIETREIDATGHIYVNGVCSNCGAGNASFAITKQPEIYVGPIGSTASFHVEAVGDSLTYQWYYSPDNVGWSASGLTGNKTDTLQVAFTASRVGQFYRCEVRSASGETLTSDAVFMCEALPPITIQQQPESFMGQAGETGVFHVSATGEGLTYQWIYSKDNGVTWSKSGQTGSTTDTMKIQLTMARAGQCYRCEIKDLDGNILNSEQAAIKLETENIEIKYQPVSANGYIGETTTFHVEATGMGLTYQWYYSKDGGRTWSPSGMAGFDTDTLKVQLTAARVGQSYRCAVTDNKGNTVYSNVVAMNQKISVVGVLEIQQQPKDFTGKVGDTAVFYVDAVGEALTFQWQYSKDGKTWEPSGLPGSKTDTLRVDVTASRIGQRYRCVITDANGKELISSPVMLKQA